MQWNINLVNEARTQSFNRANGCVIIRIAGDDRSRIDGTNKGSNCAAGLICKAASAKCLADRKADVPDAEPDVVGIANFEVDVARVLTLGSKNAEMIKWNQAARWVAGDHADESQADLITG